MKIEKLDNGDIKINETLLSKQTSLDIALLKNVCEAYLESDKLIKEQFKYIEILQVQLYQLHKKLIDIIFPTEEEIFEN